MSESLVPPRFRLIIGRRLVCDFDDVLTDEERAARFQLLFAASDTFPPEGATANPPYLWAEQEEPRRRRQDPELDRECAAIEAELVALRPGAVRKSPGLVAYDFTGLPDLEGRWKRALDAGEQREIARQPPLPVKVGDFVQLGPVMRVRSVDPLHRRVGLDALDENDQVVGGHTGVPADQLRPLLLAPGDKPPPFPRAPAPVEGGLTVARFVKNTILVALRVAGLADH